MTGRVGAGAAFGFDVTDWRVYLTMPGWGRWRGQWGMVRGELALRMRGRAWSTG